MDITMDYMAGTVRASSLRMYKRDVSIYNKWCAGQELDPATPRALVLWRAYLVECTTYKYSTIARMISAVRSCVFRMVEAGMIDEVVAVAMQRVKDPNRRVLKERLGKQPMDRMHLTKDDIHLLISLPDLTTMVGVRDRALLLTMATTGVRVAEAARLRYADIRQVGDGYMVEICGKDDTTPRLVPIANLAVDAIREWQEMQGGKEYIFTAFDGRGNRLSERPISKVAIWRILRAYGAQMGREGLAPHDLRRYVGTQMTIQHGLVAASQQLGHSNPMTTARYYQTGRLEPNQANDML